MSKTYHFLVGLHFTVCTLAMIWPGALIANRIEPMVLGMLFLLFQFVVDSPFGWHAGVWGLLANVAVVALSSWPWQKSRQPVRPLPETAK